MTIIRESRSKSMNFLLRMQSSVNPKCQKLFSDKEFKQWQRCKIRNLTNANKKVPPQNKISQSLEVKTHFAGIYFKNAI